MSASLNQKSFSFCGAIQICLRLTYVAVTTNMFAFCHRRLAPIARRLTTVRDGFNILS